MKEAAWFEYDLYRRDDGRVEGRARTNDNLDTGYGSEYAEWSVAASSAEAAAKRFGVCRSGVSGVEVTVLLDGKCVTDRAQYAGG